MPDGRYLRQGRVLVAVAVRAGMPLAHPRRKQYEGGTDCEPLANGDPPAWEAVQERKKRGIADRRRFPTTSPKNARTLSKPNKFPKNSRTCTAVQVLTLGPY